MQGYYAHRAKERPLPNSRRKPPNGWVEVFTPYVTRNGKRVYRKDGGKFRFFVPPDKLRR